MTTVKNGVPAVSLEFVAKRTARVGLQKGACPSGHLSDVRCLCHTPKKKNYKCIIIISVVAFTSNIR